MVLRLIDWTIQLLVPVALRDWEIEKVCLQMWKVNVLNTSRSEWISQGENYSKGKIGFFFPVVEMVNVDLKNRNTSFFFFSPFRHVSIRDYQKPSVNVKVGELTMNWFQELSVSLHPPVIHPSQEVCVCVCPNGRGRRCGFMWSYKPSGWAELC